MADTDSIAIARLEAKIDAFVAVVGAKLEGIDHKIEFGDRSTSQTVGIIAETVNRLENNQVEQGRAQRILDPVPLRVTVIEARIAEIERSAASRVAAVEESNLRSQALMDQRVAMLERDRAKLIGFFIGISIASGGVGAVLSQLLV